MSQVLCSTGTLIGRPNGRDYNLIYPLSAKLECDGFEFMMYDSWYDKVSDIVQKLLEWKLTIPVMHCEKCIGEKISLGGAANITEALKLFEVNCQMADKLNAKKLVIHLWNGKTSDYYFQNNLDTYKELANISEAYNLELLVENVVCANENPMKRWCELAEKYPQIHFVFDTKMAAFHSELEWLYKEEYAWLWKDKHITHYHVNDYAGGYKEWEKLKTLPIGDGNIDFQKFFSFIKHIGYNDTFTIEATAFGKDGIVNVDMLNRCFKTVRGYLD